MLRVPDEDDDDSHCCTFFLGPAGGTSSEMSSMRWMLPRYAKDDQLSPLALSVSLLLLLLAAVSFAALADPADPADPVAGLDDVSGRSGWIRCPCVLEYMADSSVSSRVRCTSGP